MKLFVAVYKWGIPFSRKLKTIGAGFFQQIDVFLLINKIQAEPFFITINGIPRALIKRATAE